MTRDASSVLIDGPWEHRFVAANGARFHVAMVSGDGDPAHSSPAAGVPDRPLVLLLHGFPQFWWAWRHQLVALAAAGYPAAALDLRGFGGSDKPPRGYDTFTSAADVASVVRTLGATRAVVVGSSLGAWTAWAMPSMQPTVTAAVAALSMPHPLVLRRATALEPAQAAASGWVAGLQRPFVPERQMARGARANGGSGYVERLLQRWAAPGYPWPSGVPGRYADAMAIPFVAHSAAEYYRWMVRSQVRLDGRRFAARVQRPIDVPVLQLQGGRDGAVLAGSTGGSGHYVRGPYEHRLLPVAGHFLAEEAAAETTALLLAWLRKVIRED